MDMVVTYIDGSKDIFQRVEEVEIENGCLVFRYGPFGHEVGIPISQIRKYEIA